MARQRILRFPAGFLWGTASSSHQCEGGNTNNQWYRWEQQGHVLTGESSGEAANWWQRAESDFAQAEQMGNNALRLSLEWSRIEPDEGCWDSEAIDRYRAMLTDLRNRHMKPIVTLHHFTEPLWFADLGGFAKQENIRVKAARRFPGQPLLSVSQKPSQCAEKCKIKTVRLLQFLCFLCRLISGTSISLRFVQCILNS